MQPNEKDKAVNTQKKKKNPQEENGEIILKFGKYHCLYSSCSSFEVLLGAFFYVGLNSNIKYDAVHGKKEPKNTKGQSSNTTTNGLGGIRF